MASRSSLTSRSASWRERVCPLPRLLEDPLDPFAEGVQRGRLGGARLALVDGDAPVQFAQLAHGRGEPALGLRGAVQRVVEPPLLVRHVPIDLLGVVTAPVDIEYRSGHLLLCDWLVLVHVPSRFPPRMLPSSRAKGGDTRQKQGGTRGVAAIPRRRTSQRAD